MDLVGHGRVAKSQLLKCTIRSMTGRLMELLLKHDYEATIFMDGSASVGN